MSDTPKNISTSSPQTDTEAGEEGENIEKSKRALRVMLNRGLIDEDTYQKRLCSLTNGDQSN